MAGKRFIIGFILSLALMTFSWPGAQTAQASCGAVSCFVVIGSQQQVPQAGVLTVNAMYNYTPMRLLGWNQRGHPSGGSGGPSVDFGPSSGDSDDHPDLVPST